jgi:hypothetical protein
MMYVEPENRTVVILPASERNGAMSEYMLDPDSTLDFSWDWSWWLEGETISSQVITVEPAGSLRVTTETRVGGKITARLTGGLAGVEYMVGCRVTTSGGQVDERSMKIVCVER